MFSAPAIALGDKVADGLSKKAWRRPDGLAGNSTIRFLPQNLAPFIPEGPSALSPFCLFSSIRKLLAHEFFHVWAHIFIGACGIAVRAIAPFLVHKSKDPPVIVIDPAGQYVISLLSGHWGGGNDLARHLAGILNAQAVLSTASEFDDCPALDLHIRQAGLKILDWPKLASFQGRILRGEDIYLYDPGAFLGSPDWVKSSNVPEESKCLPLLAVDWKRREQREGLLRIVPALFCLGFGFRKGVCADEMLQAFHELCLRLNLAFESVAICATVEEKAQDAEARKFTRLLDMELKSFPATQLAAIRTPNPSCACAARFCLIPFSVCESAALAGASEMRTANMPHRQNDGREANAHLYSQKFIYNKRITMALALPKACWIRISQV